MTTIYCVNSSSVKTSDMILMINALNTLLPAFCIAWAPQGVTYRVAIAPVGFKPTSAYCIFMDNADVAGAMAYHTETGNVPVSMVFVKTVLKYGAVLMGATNAVPTVAQAFSHEIFEMIANMNVNIWWQLSNGYLVPGEVCDPVQGDLVKVQVGSVTVGLSDYILPVWADPQATKGPYNYLNTLTKPFQVAKGGYVALMKNGVVRDVLGMEASEYVKCYAAVNRMKEHHCAFQAQEAPQPVPQPIPQPNVPQVPIEAQSEPHPIPPQ
jgi:hypothetical protein